MPQLHNETPSAQNKRLKAELAKERALVADLVEAGEPFARKFEATCLQYVGCFSDPKRGTDSFEAIPDHCTLDMLTFGVGEFRKLRAALAKANGKGL